MAKFNSPTTIKTTNKEGHAAYGMTDKAKLVTQVLTSFFQESNESRAGGGTRMHLPFEQMIRDRVKADRVIVISDNECNGGYWSSPVQKIADEYRRTSGNNIWVHAIDLQGYGTQQFHGAKTNIIAGWSEKVFDFIPLAEQGEGTLEKAISAYRW